MRGLFRFLLYAAIAVGLVWTGSIAYHQIAGPQGVQHASAASPESAMGAAMAVP